MRNSASHARLVLGVHVAFLITIGSPALAESNSRAFTCSDAFDLIATAVNIHCAGAPAVADRELAAATTALIDAGFIAAQEAAAIAMTWCPLEHVLGFTPDSGHIFINEDLEHGGTALLAEVIAHELIHTRQYTVRGADKFKCDYVAAFVACGACQGRAHALEREAYEYQDEVREYFLETWQPPTDATATD